MLQTVKRSPFHRLKRGQTALKTVETVPSSPFQTVKRYAFCHLEHLCHGWVLPLGLGTRAMCCLFERERTICSTSTGRCTCSAPGVEKVLNRDVPPSLAAVSRILL